MHRRTYIAGNMARDQEITDNVFLLTEDIVGRGPSVLRIFKTPVTINRGELVISCKEPVTVTKEDHTCTHNYCVARNPSTTFYCMEQDVVAIDDHEFKLLKAIPLQKDRYRVYSEGRLKWGTQLKPNDEVIVKLPPKARPYTLQRFNGTVRVVGALAQQPGFLIEVQLKEKDFSEVEFSFNKGYQFFFDRKQKCVLVSLDKLRKPNTTAAQEKSNDDTCIESSKYKTMSVENGVTDQDQDQPEENRLSPHLVENDQLNLDVQSRVQIPSSDPRVEYQYGVIRWIGTLHNSEELFAGIELDEKTIGCTDGTHKKSRKKYFKCPPGRGIYFPLGAIMLDERFVEHEAHLIQNPLKSVQEEEHDDQKLPDDQIQRYIGESRGIQGHHNSCFLDATLFGLFAVSTEFDEPFEEFDDDVKRRVGHLLWRGIVNPLRKNYVVKFESVMKLRDELDQVGRIKGINQEEKDPEEVLNMIFKYTLQVPPFISIRRPFGVEKEYFVQLFLEPDASLVLPTVRDLLEKMFQEQSISFTEVPSKLLVQVPRFGKQFKTFQAIIADLQLDIRSLVDDGSTCKCKVFEKPASNECSTNEYQDTSPNICVSQADKSADCNHTTQLYPTSLRRNDIYEMELLSVICIETSHYVCFTRSDKQWVFFDSMAERVHDKYNIPKVVDCSSELNEWIFCEDRNRSRLKSTSPRNLPEYVRRFTQDVYLCVYVRTMCVLNKP